MLRKDAAAHDVTLDGTSLGTLGGGESFTWTAPEAGTYQYLCTIHPSMTGEIIVR